MKARYIVLIIVAVLVIFGTPAVLAVTSGDLSEPGNEKLNALVIYSVDSAKDSYTNLVISGAYDACIGNKNIDVSILAYPTEEMEKYREYLLEELRNPTSSTKYDIVLVACQQEIFDYAAVAKEYPDITFVYLDSGLSSRNMPDNVCLFDFRGEQSAFLAGYVAGVKTDSCSVGFIAGAENPSTDRLRYGFEAGVRYAAAERGEPVLCTVTVIDTVTDSDAAESAAADLYQNGADIIMAAAGSADIGVVDAAKTYNRWVIGSDEDMSYLAPDNVLCSATKNVDSLVKDILDAAIGAKNTGVEMSGYLHMMPSQLDLDSGYVDLEGWHSSITGLTEKVSALKIGIYRDVLPIPYSAETMKTWSVVLITENQAPLIQSLNTTGVTYD